MIRFSMRVHGATEEQVDKYIKKMIVDFKSDAHPEISAYLRKTFKGYEGTDQEEYVQQHTLFWELPDRVLETILWKMDSDLHYAEIMKSDDDAAISLLFDRVLTHRPKGKMGYLLDAPKPLKRKLVQTILPEECGGQAKVQNTLERYAP